MQTNKRVRTTNARRLIVASSQGWKCAICLKILVVPFDMDHIIPLCEGGLNSIKNLCALCLQCHGHKSLFEKLRYNDKVKERKTGKSRFFDPESVDFLGSNSK